MLGNFGVFWVYYFPQYYKVDTVCWNVINLGGRLKKPLRAFTSSLPEGNKRSIEIHWSGISEIDN